MVKKGDREAWKAGYVLKILQLFDEYPKCFLVGVDNVGSNQMQKIRGALRGEAVLLMGKNTMIRRAIRSQQNSSLEKLLPHIKGNVGFVFTKSDLNEIRDKILEHKVPAAARAGALAPVNVKVPPQNTGLPPDKTSFFQALSIPTKISRGTIEILNEVHLIKVGDRVGASEAALLNMLKIYPFSYGLMLEQVFDQDSVFDPSVLDITNEQMHERFMEGIRNITCVCLGIGYPTVCSVPHSIVNGFKNILAVALEADYSFPEADQVREYLSDPSKFVAAAATSAASEAPKEEKEEEKEKEESEEEDEDDDMGFGLFDD